jgi:biopolymer transport protein ExbD
MAKVKMKRHGFALDMTPLVDVGFLLLTFFMLTAKFKSQTDEDLSIRLPVAEADTAKLPEVNIAMITIGLDSNSGAVPDTVIMFGLANENHRASVYEPMLPLTTRGGQEIRQAELSKYASVPVDLQRLDIAIRQSRMANPSMRFAIEADKGVSYGLVDDVMRIMQKYNATRFNLVTTVQG